MQMRHGHPHSHCTILVVEDETLMRRLLQRVLAKHNTSILLAADGEEAVHLYHDNKQEICVVLLDLGLPKMSGWEVFDNLRQDNPDVPIVVASGYMEPVLKSRLYQAGVEHFIDKPYSLDQLAQTLQSVMNGAGTI